MCDLSSLGKFRQRISTMPFRSSQATIGGSALSLIAYNVSQQPRAFSQLSYYLLPFSHEVALNKKFQKMSAKGPIEYDFGYGDKCKYHVFPARDVPTVDEVSGLYAWYLRIPRKSANDPLVPAYANLFRSRRMRVSLKGHLGEHYEGTAKSRSIATPTPLTQLLADATLAFSPPIYIGISSHLRTRLQQHISALERVLYSSESSVERPDTAFDLDTNDESRHFGERIGKLMLQAGMVSLDALVIRLLYGDSYSRDQIVAAEYFLNRVYTPLSGRR